MWNLKRKDLPEPEIAPIEPTEYTGPQGLPAPSPCIVLSMTTVLDGPSSIQYVGDPAWAVAVLRDMADSIEKEKGLV